MRDRTIVGLLVLVLAVAGYLVSNSPETREAIGAAATTAVRPVVLPLVELINVPAFVYCAALLILLAGILSCVVYRFRSVGPRIAELKVVRGLIADLPAPRLQGGAEPKDWPKARQGLGTVLMRERGFVAPWTAFQADSRRTAGVPRRPFSRFVAADPEPRGSGEELMHSLPAYFTSVGLIFTFIGLVVALYFAAKGFRTGDMAEARAAIIQLLNAASFKFLTSVSALISALIVSVYGRYAGTLVRQQRNRTLERIDVYLANWREKVGTGRPEQRLEPADLLRRFDHLLAGVASLSTDLKRMAERCDGLAGPGTDVGERGTVRTGDVAG